MKVSVAGRKTSWATLGLARMGFAANYPAHNAFRSAKIGAMVNPHA